MTSFAKSVPEIFFFLLLIGMTRAEPTLFEFTPSRLNQKEPNFFQDPAYLIGYLFCWNFLFEISLVLVIHFKQHPNHVIEHATLNFLVVGGQLLNNIVFFAGHDIRNGYFLGELLILLLTLLQTSFGLWLNRKLLSDQLVPGIFLLRLSHRALGNLIYILTKIQICIYLYYFYLGTDISPLVAIGLLLGLTFVNHLALKAVLSRRKLSIMEVNKFLIEDSTKSQAYFDLIKNIESGDIQMEEDDFVMATGLSDASGELTADFGTPRIDWVVIENKVFDITDLRHPKGNYILRAINRRDITRQIYGIKSWRFENREINYHKHSTHAHVARTFEFLKDSCIGEVPLNPIIVNAEESTRMSAKSAATINLFHLAEKDVSEIQRRMQGWKTQQIQLIDESPKSRILLASKKDGEYLINLSSYWLKNFGKYFLVRRSDSELAYFYVTLSLSPKYLSEKRKWLGALQAGAAKEFLRAYERSYSELISLHELLDNSLPKKTKNSLETGEDVRDAFLPLLELGTQPETKFDKSVEYSVHGPLGTGLGFTGAITKRTLIAIQDEGVIPFLDFFEFLSQRALVELNKGNPPHFIFGSEYLLAYSNGPEFYVYWEISDSFLERAEILGLSALKLIGRLQAGLSSNEFGDATSRVCEMVKRVTIVTSKAQAQKGGVVFSTVNGYDFKTIKDLASNESFGRIEMAVVSGRPDFVERVLLNADLRPSQIEIL